MRQFIAFPDLFPSGRDDAGLGRWANALTSGPSSELAIFGVISGFVVALVTAIIASATARAITPAAAPVAEPVQEPAWSPETAAPWGAEYGQPAEGGVARPGDTAQLPQEPYSASTGNPELAQYATERAPTVAHPDEPTVAGQARTAELPDVETAEPPLPRQSPSRSGPNAARAYPGTIILEGRNAIVTIGG